MKVILIDPKEQTIQYINIELGLTAIYKAMECRLFACPVEFSDGDVLYVDDEALFHEDKTHGFLLNNWDYPIFGKCLVMGTNNEGNSIEPKSTIEFFTEQIRYVKREAK